MPKICFDGVECQKESPCCSCKELERFEPTEEQIGCAHDCDTCFTPIC